MHVAHWLQGSDGAQPLAARNWGHHAAYALDPDGHVLAFAALERTAAANLND